MIAGAKSTLPDILRAFEKQAGFCRHREAEATARLCEAAALSIKAGEGLQSLVENYREDPWKTALPLRIAGAVRRLALEDRAPLFADHDAAPKPVGELVAPLNELVAAAPEVFRDYISSPPQTNEIGRLAVLAPGFIKIFERFGLPLALLEPGASGGLLLGFDRFQIDFGAFQWGRGAGVVRSEWRGGPPAWPWPLPIHSRRGCDRRPIDLSDQEQYSRMLSYIWPEQTERRVTFAAAVEATHDLDIEVEASDAVDWLRRQLASPVEGAARVVYHSVFAPYLDPAQKRALRSVVEAAGAKATERAPLAWLRFEPVEAGESFEFFLDLTLWPNGEDQRLAKAHPHGAWVEPVVQASA